MMARALNGQPGKGKHVLENLRRQKFLPFTLLLFTLCVGIVIGTLFNTRVSAAHGQSVAPDATPLTIPSPVQLGNEFTKLAHKLEPSVVNITAEFTPKEGSATARPVPKPAKPDEDEEDQGGGDENSQDFLHRFFRAPVPLTVTRAAQQIQLHLH